MRRTASILTAFAAAAALATAPTPALAASGWISLNNTSYDNPDDDRCINAPDAPGLSAINQLDVPVRVYGIINCRGPASQLDAGSFGYYETGVAVRIGTGG
ncbi:hypothetical protein ACFO4E_19255 [Nocardiopsis mangrovi]|uniref:Uncharacterized protein n=1 Tax=Nocardiopsis mangrovi TaxID=1179818 RepID=A0ABV9DYU6_9ACTN